MSEPRRPAAFRVEPERARPEPEKAKPEREPETARKPRAIPKSEVAVVVPAEIDVFETDDAEAREPPPAIAPRRRSRLGAIFLAALGALLSLAIGLWIDRLIRDLFDRYDWLGWVAVAAAGIATVTLLVILIRELAALSRLASVEKIRRRALDAIARDDSKAARAVVADLTAFVAGKPE